LRRLGGDLLTHDVRLNGQLASAPVYENGQGDSPRSTEVRQLVECGAHGAARVEHVVDDDDDAPVYIHWNLRLADDRPRAGRLEVVRVERDVQRALRDVRFFPIADGGHDTRRELSPAALNSYNDEIVGPVVQFYDLVGDSPERPVKGPGVEHRRLLCGHGA